jgi:glycosyltransferase involved in cell wall biosynthesis
MKIIFIGGLFPEKLQAEIERKSKGTIDYAADTLQKALIEGLDNYTNYLKIINLPFLNIYPFYSAMRIRSFNFSHNQFSDHVNVGFLNLPIFKKISRYINTKKELNRSITTKEEVILIYSLHTPFIRAAIGIKRKFPSIKVCVIVPDLMQFTSEESRWSLLRFINNKERQLLNGLLEEVDGFVVLSDLMHDALNIKERPWVRVEGIFNKKDIQCNVEKENFKTIMYSGALAKRYGIMNLLNAFSNINEQDYRLWICGNGDCKDEIIKRAELDNRIIYFGQIPRNEVLKLQKKATILINPRTSNGEFTKFSFPSKLMEYLGSGTPCIIHRLPGIPDEYYQYVFVAKEETVEGLKSSIINLCSKNSSELKQMGELAKNFVMNDKTPIKQCHKIVKMLSSLLDGS